MSLPNVEVTTNLEKSLCFNCPDFIEKVNNLDCYGRKSKNEKDYYISTIRCKKTKGYPVPRLRCEWR